ncbi:MAG: outer membrane protein OmpA-like peptidoglycan-associated protein [Rhodothermales bacterium]|jgi:outer membrane protein OmpA-like peptidoglycan-associated protein
MSKTLRLIALSLILSALSIGNTQAQSNQFRDSRAHLGVAAGLFTYHGPTNLMARRSSTNFVRESDPAVVFFGSFPIRSDRFYFRGMVALTNFSQKDGEDLVAAQPAPSKNEFLTSFLLLFEPELVMTLTPGSKSRFLPYIFTGFGAMIADPFKSEPKIDIPGTGVPGPERSVYHLPIGAGIDVAFNGCWSVFAEASWRFDLNYVWRNESDYDPHNTSLVLGGLRMCMNRRTARAPEPTRIPAPMTVPAYAPPLPESPLICPLVELNSVYFEYGSAELGSEFRNLLDENIEALVINEACCVEIIGYTDRDDSGIEALRMSRARAEAVFNYYVRSGLPADMFTVSAEGFGESCGKAKDTLGPGCPRARRVDSLPFDCARVMRNAILGSGRSNRSRRLENM